METCTDPIGAPGPEPEGPAGTGAHRWAEWSRGWRELRESLDSEWSAAYQAFSTPGAEARRKWLGWALYRLAARLNPEIRD